VLNSLGCLEEVLGGSEGGGQGFGACFAPGRRCLSQLCGYTLRYYLRPWNATPAVSLCSVAWFIMVIESEREPEDGIFEH
jgi:hypothetical protein